ncbi:chaplin family protein [Streptomyces sp. NPDC048208]|uniref:chaplin n=1 Tax=Streptomyces sp. NPDC048208 TaxID=3365515 RepID=UPI003712BFDA
MRQGTRKGLMTMAAATGVIAAAGGYAHADSGAAGSATRSPGVLSGNTVQVPVHVPVNACGNTVDVVGLLNPAAGNACGNGARGGPGGAHAGGRTSDSPGVGSGNTVQVPIDVPVNLCGNSVDVIGVGNPALGNRCGNGGPGRGQENPPGRPGSPGHPEHPGNPGTPGHPGHHGGSCPPGHHGHHPGHPGNPGTPGNPGNPGQPGNPGTPGNPGQPSNPGNPGTPTRPHTPSTPATPATPSTGGGHTPQGASQVGHQGGHASGGQLAHTGGDLPLGLGLSAGAGAVLAGAVLYRKARNAA